MAVQIAEVTGATSDPEMTLTVRVDGKPMVLRFDDENARRLYFTAGEHIGAIPSLSEWARRALNSQRG